MAYYVKTKNTHTRASGSVPSKALPRVDGLYVSGLRYYSPQIGRWLSRDPLGEFAGENLYVFVFNNSLRWLDLIGLSCCNGGAAVDCNKLMYNMKLLYAQMNRILAQLDRIGTLDDKSRASKLDTASDYASYLGLIQTLVEEGLKGIGRANGSVGSLGKLSNVAAVGIDSTRAGDRLGDALTGKGSFENVLDPLLNTILTIVSAAKQATAAGKIVAAGGGVTIAALSKVMDGSNEYNNALSELLYIITQGSTVRRDIDQFKKLAIIYDGCCP